MASYTPAPAAPPILRQGNKLIIPQPPPGQPAVLPPLCVKCAAAADGKPVVKTVYWHHPALFLIVILSPLIYVIVALVARKGMKMCIPLCALHAKRRSTGKMLAWVLPVVGIADIFVLQRFNVDGALIAAIAVLLILVGLVIWANVANPLRPTLIDATRGEFTGMCTGFLEQFPETGLPQPLSQPGLPPPPIG